MSLLSDTQGRPERVWSLVRLLDALGGRVTRDDLHSWMMPVSFRENDKSLSHVSQTLGSARSLGLVSDEGNEIKLELDLPDDITAFMDLVHQRLCTPHNEADRVLFHAYACVVLETERTRGTDWLTDQNTEQIASRINTVLVGNESERVFNNSKVPAWRAWMVALGLAFEGASGFPHLFPQPAERLLRELPAIVAKHGRGVEIRASTFMAEVAERMPYVDGGSIHTQIADQMQMPRRPGWIGNVLSEALRDLHDDRVIELISRADAPDSLSLAQETGSLLRSFVSVIIPDGSRSP
jgi:hypothetical protein